MTRAEMRFDPVAVQAWRRTVYREFKRCGFKNGTRAMAAAVTLASVAEFGTDLSVLEELTGHSQKFIGTVLRQLRREGVLRGQTLRIRWDRGNGFEQRVAIGLDAMTAAGEIARFKDPAHVERGRKAAAHRRSTATTPRSRVMVTSGAVFTPKRCSSNPFYGLPEWKSK